MDKEIEVGMDKYGTLCKLQRFPVAGRADVVLVLSSHDENVFWFKDKVEFEQFIETLVACKNKMWTAEQLAEVA